MAFLKRLSLALPILRKAQTCPACGESFACELSLGKGCWCAEVELSEPTRQELRAKYNGCLCRACLEGAEASLAANPRSSFTNTPPGKRT